MTFKPKKRKRSQSGWSGEQVIRLLGVAGIILLLVLGGLGIGSQNAQNAAISPTPGPGTPTAVTFPDVPLDGTPLVEDKTYFHPTGLFSVPHFVGFDIAVNSEERVDPTQSDDPQKIARMGATFIDSAVLGVLHVFIENNPSRNVRTIDDMEKVFDKTYLDSAWSNFTGGYKETRRVKTATRVTIDAELYLSGSTYLGRQTAELQDGWEKVTRLVAPANNPGLLDNLEAKVWQRFTFYPALLTQPVGWSAVTDTVAGYILRFPPTWSVTAAAPGLPQVVIGTENGFAVTLTTRADPGRTVRSADDAKAWVRELRPQSTVLNVATESRQTENGTVTGFTVSYNDPDSDGNSRSALVTLLNGNNGTLYTANYLYGARSLDLLKAEAVPANIAASRNSFFLLDVRRLIATLTPVPTVTPLPTTPTAVGTPAAAAPGPTPTP